MKNFQPLVKFITLIALLLYSADRLQAQGTAFTYQGRLNAVTNPANGIYDATFALFSVASGAGQVGTTQTNLATAVSNGFFTIVLDFGANFPGGARWLEITVRTNGSGAFTTLSPRQKLTPTPYAITASNLTGNLPAAQLSGTLPAAQLGGTYNNSLTFNNAGNSFTGSGVGLTGVNALTLGGLSASSFWKLLGNPGTTSNNFLGTTDNQPLQLRVNNQRAMRFESSGAGAVNVIGGWVDNNVLPGVTGATISGGGASNSLGFVYSNHIEGSFATISGGRGNMILKNDGFLSVPTDSSIGGGQSNTVNTMSSVIGGGQDNTIGNQFSRAYETGHTIGGGIENSINYENSVSTIGGGRNNFVDASRSVIAGGEGNKIQFIGTSASGHSIGGGVQNTIASSAYPGFGVLAGGENNTVVSAYATVSGGQSNTAAGGYSAISGGQQNTTASGSDFSTVAGGHFNFVSGKNSTVSGGESNSAQTTISSTIGGGAMNKISDPTASGAYYHTIAGGISNAITSHGSLFEAGNTIGGGIRNGINYQTGNSTIGGGTGNGIATDSPGSTIGGGNGNSIDTANGTIAGGIGNIISSYTFTDSAIGGGNGNKITASMDSTIAGGAQNSINGSGGWGGASIGGGNNNSLVLGSGGALGPFGVSGVTIAGGYTNTIANSWSATIGGGYSNRIASGTTFGTIPGGAQAKVSNYGQMAYASGQFAAGGDAQTSIYVARGTTANATPADLFLNGVSARIVVPVNSTWSYDILLAGRTTGGSSAGYQIRGVIENNAGTTALVGSPTVTVLAEDVAAWDATAVADNANDALVVRVTGAAATTIRWVATVRTVEVTY